MKATDSFDHDGNRTPGSHFAFLRRILKDAWMEALTCPETVLETGAHRISLRLLRYCAYHAPHIAYDLRHTLSDKRRAVILAYTIEMAGLAFNDEEVKHHVFEAADSMLDNRSVWDANFTHNWKALFQTFQMFTGYPVGADTDYPEEEYPSKPIEPAWLSQLEI